MTLLLGVLAGCTPADVDCLSLQGGYEGWDVEAIEAECRANDYGYDCESDHYIQADAVRCICEDWFTSDDLEFALSFSPGQRTVTWTCHERGDNRYLLLRASDGEVVATLIAEPVGLRRGRRTIR